MSLDTSGGHPAMDYAEHKRTYAGFLVGAKVLTTICILIVVFLALFVR